MDSREEFEDLVCKVTNARNFTIREEDGEYASERVQDMFLIWKAARDPSRHDGESLARRFHEIYERMAPTFGYQTRDDTKQFDPESANGRLMVAVCKEILTQPQPAQQGSVPEKKPLPEIFMASYHEAIGWNACVDAILSATPQQEGGVPETSDIEKLRCQQCGNMEPFHATGCETEYGNYAPIAPQPEGDGWIKCDKQQLRAISSNLQYAGFNLFDNFDFSRVRKTVDSTCPEASLLIAIRDLSELIGDPIPQPPVEQEDIGDE